MRRRACARKHALANVRCAAVGATARTRQALDALQEEFEAYGVELMASANHLTTEVRRAQVLELRDMQSAVYLTTGNVAYRKGYTLFTGHMRLSKTKSKPRRRAVAPTAAEQAASAVVAAAMDDVDPPAAAAGGGGGGGGGGGSPYASSDEAEVAGN